MRKDGKTGKGVCQVRLAISVEHAKPIGMGAEVAFSRKQEREAVAGSLEHKPAIRQCVQCAEIAHLFHAPPDARRTHSVEIDSAWERCAISARYVRNIGLHARVYVRHLFNIRSALRKYN